MKYTTNEIREAVIAEIKSRLHGKSVNENSFYFEVLDAAFKRLPDRLPDDTKREELIKKHLEDWQEPQLSSIYHYAKSGKASGSFFMALKVMLDEHAENLVKPDVRFQLPSNKQMIDIAILFNDGKLEAEKLADMVGYGQFIVDRLYENGDVGKPSSKEEDDRLPDDTKTMDDEPYFGWCNVKGCENEGCSGGSAWRESGYWTVCYKHADDYRNGKPQPPMKKAAIDREASRDENGCITVDLKVPQKEI
jgi:hypothetical protein